MGLLGHTWSLSIEEQFYLLWPSVLILLGARRAGTIAAVLIVIITLHPHPGDRAVRIFLHRHPRRRGPCGLRSGHRPGPAPDMEQRGRGGAILILAVLDLPHDFAITLVILAAAAVVCSSSQRLGVLAPMGKRAYGLYLWNWPLAILVGPVAVPLTFVAAELSGVSSSCPSTDGATTNHEEQWRRRRSW